MLTIERKRYYGTGQRGWFYAASLQGTAICTAPTSIAAKEQAYRKLSQWARHISNTTAVRMAHDGTVLLVREYEDGVAQVEYNRSGVSSSLSIGQMTKGNGVRCKDVQEYAEYLLAEYQK